jgi:hypothetical protein
MQHYITATVDSGESYDLTTAAAVAALLGITADAALEAQVTATSKLIAELCDRPFVRQTVHESFRLDYYESPRRELKLDRWPVQEIISITENDSVVDPAQYEFNNESGVVWKVSWGWWGFCPGLTVVNYISGYNLPDEAPPPLALAASELIRGAQFSAARDPTIRSTTHGDTSVTFAVGNGSGSGGTVSSTVNGLLAPYRRKVLGG